MQGEVDPGVARTIDELAQLSGVSRATVSRVINGGSVSERTRRRVQAVLAETNYRPNLAARSLASGRSGVVGVVMHIDAHLLFRDPYFGQLLEGMSGALADVAAGMMLWLGNRSKEETLDTILSMGLADGVIVTAHNLDDPLVDGLLASSLPTVLVGHRRTTGRRATSTSTTSTPPTRSPRTSSRSAAPESATSPACVATSLPRIGSSATAVPWTEPDCRATGWSSTATSTRPRAWSAPRRSSTIGATRSSAPTTRPPWVRSRRSAREAFPYPRTWPSPASTTSSSRPTSIHPSRPSARTSTSRAPRRPARCSSSSADRDGAPRRVILPTELVIRQSTVGGVLRP